MSDLLWVASLQSTCLNAKSKDYDVYIESEGLLVEYSWNIADLYHNIILLVNVVLNHVKLNNILHVYG